MDEEIKERIRKLREQHGIPVPKKGVPLFESGGDEAYVGNIYPSYDTRALGFKLAADKLVEMLPGAPWHTDYFVYPIPYLYRMYIELRLKELIHGASGSTARGHDLLKLWERAKPIMKSCSQWFDDQELDAVQDTLRQFSEIDPFSDAFRYPTNAKGTKITLQGIKELNLKSLKEVVDSISTPLEGSSTALYEARKSW